MSVAKKGYNTVYKKNSSDRADRMRRSPKGVLSCPGCGAVYFHGRWSLDSVAAIRARIAAGDATPADCPACRKIRRGEAQGVVEIAGAADQPETLRLLRNEESRAREKNPLERIVAIVTDQNGIKVETTTEKLAQRLGRCLKKAGRGKLRYQWSHRNKFARVYVGPEA